MDQIAHVDYDPSSYSNTSVSTSAIRHIYHMNKDLQRLAVQQLGHMLPSGLRRFTHLYGENLLAMDSISCSVMYLQLKRQQLLSCNIICGDHGRAGRSNDVTTGPIEYIASHRQQESA